MSNERTTNTVSAVEPSEAESIGARNNTISPQTDVYLNNDGLTFFVNVPGVAKGNVVIEIDDNNTMRISAKNAYSEPEGAILRQFSTGSFYRSFQLSDEYDNDKVTAVVNNGLLKVTIARKESAKPRTIEISA
jgi:HSP20 family protein